MRSYVKAVFWGKVIRVEETTSYHETNGPVIVKGDILQQRLGDNYSFIMKDQVVEQCVTTHSKVTKRKGIAESTYQSTIP